MTLERNHKEYKTFLEENRNAHRMAHSDKAAGRKRPGGANARHTARPNKKLKENLGQQNKTT